ncbi:histidine kinase [Oleiagrimonas sp. C23AA]|uniref:sensor histidine kinase n=1 Tax=Oleiagrimonas sp. C23AA TaxID=2719047 RepID=UPI0014218117|nr:histidine kinase [Oleiagrimonas sp. C23AA]NII11063.1 histidine kinase [Oleiagrimonas sp. C23AA]
MMAFSHRTGMLRLSASFSRSTHTLRSLPAFSLPLLAGLPIGLCLIVMDLPALGQRHALPVRAVLLLAFMAWTVPATALQRALWKRRVRTWMTALVMLAVTYAMSVGNNLLILGLFRASGWGLPPSFHWASLFRGLESCWLALIAFCAAHAVITYAFELRQEQAERLQAHALARDAELRALRYQLQPHFLFNTLNAISSLVNAHRPSEASHMITCLGDFLRATLDAPAQHEVVLADEIVLTETFLDIEKARLGDRLILHWCVGPNVLHALVPCLLMQPLVENAIRHGIARRQRPGHLTVEVKQAHDRLRMRVHNDTAGMAPPSSTMGWDRDDNVGLGNVRERLAHLYPGTHRFDAGPCADGGYEVRLSLPLRLASSRGEYA